VLSTGLIKDALASSPENAEIANELETAAKNATKLTGRLLSLGRQGKPRQAEIHVDRAIRELEPMLHVLVRGFITLRINLRADDAVIVADPLAIEQVVLNLVSNARDAIASEGSIAVTTELVRREDTTWVRLRVEDSGAGMDQATLASIFEPFFSTKGERGSGLGLYTTATLVRQAGGHIEATSTPGAGTTFVVDLPVKTP
jgi:signal transduction histidine kinase